MYSKLTKVELIALLATRDEQITLMELRCAHVQASAQRAIANARVAAPAPKRTAILKPVKAFATKELFLAWAGEKASSFVVTKNEVSGELVANLREWK
jgi:hypothetical protein